MRKQDTVRHVALVGCVFGVGLATQYLAGKAWEKSTSKPPPKNPAAADVSWPEALLWAAFAGVAVGLTRTVARRVLSEVKPGRPPRDSV